MSIRHSLSHFAIGLLVTLRIAAANAVSTPSDLIGVWRGTLGKKEVVACWDKGGGNYYTLQKPSRLALSADEQRSGVWIENDGNETPTEWQLRRLNKRHLTGTRRKGVNGKSMPIYLNRVQVTAKIKTDQQYCSFDSALYVAFNAPRVSLVKVHTAGRSFLINREYHVISALAGNIASVELVGGEESVNKVNKLLRDQFVDDIRSYLTCDVYDPPEHGDFHTKIHLRFWTDELLSWSSHAEGYCGGAHPFFDLSVKTINLQTGKEINLWNWFKLVRKRDHSPGQICEHLGSRCLPTSLSKRIGKLRQHVEDSHCGDFDFHLDEADEGYSIGLNQNGVAFIPELPESSRAFRTCYANFTLPFAELPPYLNKAGSAFVDRILAPRPNPAFEGTSHLSAARPST